MLYLELNVDLNINLKKKERSKNNIKNSNQSWNQWPLQKQIKQWISFPATRITDKLFCEIILQKTCDIILILCYSVF